MPPPIINLAQPVGSYISRLQHLAELQQQKSYRKFDYFPIWNFTFICLLSQLTLQRFKKKSKSVILAVLASWQPRYQLLVLWSQAYIDHLSFDFPFSFFNFSPSNIFEFSFSWIFAVFETKMYDPQKRPFQEGKKRLVWYLPHVGESLISMLES